MPKKEVTPGYLMSRSLYEIKGIDAVRFKTALKENEDKQEKKEYEDAGLALEEVIDRMRLCGLELRPDLMNEFFEKLGNAFNSERKIKYGDMPVYELPDDVAEMGVNISLAQSLKERETLEGYVAAHDIFFRLALFSDSDRRGLSLGPYKKGLSRVEIEREGYSAYAGMKYCGQRLQDLAKQQ